MAAPAQAVHQTATSASPTPIVTVGPATSLPESSTGWSAVRGRAKQGAWIAAAVTGAVLVAIVVFLYLKSRPKASPKQQSIASINLPTDQLQKLSGESINVASDRKLTFNTPVIVKQDLNVNGQTTLNNVKITGALVLPTAAAASASPSQNLSVAGAALIQGDTTAKGSLTVGGNLNVSGSASFAGNLNANQLTVKSATLGNATIGHLITSGPTATASPNNAAGGGTVSMTGNDTAGTVTITTGNGAPSSGDLITVTFRSAYTSTPHVTVTPVGIGTASSISAVGGIYYVSRSTSQFTIGVSKMQLGVGGVTYVFDYFVTQ